MRVPPQSDDAVLNEIRQVTTTQHPVVTASRRGRLEEQLHRAIVEGAPRSRIRDAVDQLVVHLRGQQLPATRGVAVITEVATSAVSTVAVEPRIFGAPADVLSLIAGWASTRYARAD